MLMAPVPGPPVVLTSMPGWSARKSLSVLAPLCSSLSVDSRSTCIGTSRAGSRRRVAVTMTVCMLASPSAALAAPAAGRIAAEALAAGAGAGPEASWACAARDSEPLASVNINEISLRNGNGAARWAAGESRSIMFCSGKVDLKANSDFSKMEINLSQLEI
jgi:hypothetical protein